MRVTLFLISFLNLYAYSRNLATIVQYCHERGCVHKYRCDDDGALILPFNKKLPKILSHFHHQDNTWTHTQTLDKDQLLRRRLELPIKITTINVKNKLRKGGEGISRNSGTSTFFLFKEKPEK
jgi:hypothetical protein